MVRLYTPFYPRTKTSLPISTTSSYGPGSLEEFRLSQTFYESLCFAREYAGIFSWNTFENIFIFVNINIYSRTNSLSFRFPYPLGFTVRLSLCTNGARVRVINTTLSPYAHQIIKERYIFDCHKARNIFRKL